MSLFDDQTNVVPKLEDFVGEGKKYRDQDAVAKALVEKDNFIERLKAEKDEIYKEMTTRPVVDRSQEILDRIEALKNPPVTERQPVTTGAERTEVNTLSVDDIERVLNERENRARAKANIDQVKAKLQEKFGNNYGQALKSLAEKNGLSAQALDNLAATSPQLIFNLLPQIKADEWHSPPNSSVSTDPQLNSTKRNEAYYKRLKATDKAAFFSKEVQAQQYKDMMALQEDYYT